MATDWELPAMGNDSSYGTPWQNTANETMYGGFIEPDSDLGELQFSKDSDWFDFGDESWFVNSTGGGQGGDSSSWLSDAAGDVWDWLKTPQGTNVTSGAIKGLMEVWKQDLAERMKGNKDDGPSAAELYDARVKVHNASINKPMDMGLVRFNR